MWRPYLLILLILILWLYRPISTPCRPLPWIGGRQERDSRPFNWVRLERLGCKYNRRSELQKHGLVNYIDTKGKCRHLKILTCNGTSLGAGATSEFIDWWYSQWCWYFRRSFVNCCPSTFSLVQLSPPPCVSKYTVLYTYSVCRGGGMGLWASDR